MKFKVVNAGNCIICGKPIKLAVLEDTNKFPNVLFCKNCGPKLEYDDLKRRDKDGE